jgi:hypothetical protein
MCAVGNAFYMIFGFLFTYYLSFLKETHESYTASTVFGVTVSLDIGIIVANFVFERMVKICNVQNVLRIYSIMVFVNMYFMANYPFILYAHMTNFIAGFCHQLLTVSIIYILTKKYQGNLTTFTGYVFSGSALAICVWGMMFSLVVNPKNLPKDRYSILVSGEKEYYFPSEVSNNFPKWCYIYGLFNLLVPIISSFFINLKKPEDDSLNESLSGDHDSSHSILSENVHFLKNSHTSSRLVEGMSIGLLERVSQSKSYKILSPK